jgi:NAD(P)-dependent dehydrogenase (short-subunit alcohol dehydrogenase family)
MQAATSPPDPTENVMTGKLEGKVAVVTGGSAGIGLAAAKRFAEAGAYVFITGRRQPELDAAVKEIGPKAVAVRADSSDIADLAHLFDKVKAAKGRIDVLFANAGVYEFTPFGTITEGAYDKMFDINVKGVLFTVQQAVPLVRRVLKPARFTAPPRRRSALSHGAGPSN